ncbi:protein of unknown function [Hyphomicrobium sp. 1Nfss2.1]|uniref:hypothetical protein n=1 Tax=Hyphomicrobium sp. 1Nfss2.1 TaxID=3413936 RepID=UPI003C798C1B
MHEPVGQLPRQRRFLDSYVGLPLTFGERLRFRDTRLRPSGYAERNINLPQNANLLANEWISDALTAGWTQCAKRGRGHACQLFDVL